MVGLTFPDARELSASVDERETPVPVPIDPALLDAQAASIDPALQDGEFIPLHQASSPIFHVIYYIVLMGIIV